MTQRESVAIPRSAVEGIAWPAVVTTQSAAMLAMQYQLQVSQWWNASTLLQCQLQQMSCLFDHAYRTIPFYQQRLDAAGYHPGQPVCQEILSRVPILSRRELQEQGGALLSRSIPADHGSTVEVASSGSTGRPVRAHRTALASSYWRALTLRDHLWHQRDFSAKLASIRHDVKNGLYNGWGRSTDVSFTTGPVAALNISTDLNDQLAWLVEQAPDYLLSYPSNILALAQLCAAKRVALPSLRQVRTLGEVVSNELRDVCESVWGVNVVDSYTAQEVGYIALQCPLTPSYHVQAETMFVEILNDQDQPCGPGEVGRVVVTPLHNFATVLLRYEIGDYAEVGSECTCGRGLPVLSRIHGRVRNMLHLPNGAVRWPVIGGPIPTILRLPARQYQVVQKSLSEIEVRVVASRQFNAEETKALTIAFNKAFGFDFTINWVYVDAIPRSPTGKYEEFVSEI